MVKKLIHAFPKALVWSEMQTASSKIWTRVADSISNIDKSR